MQSRLCFITAAQRLGKSCISVRTPSLLMRLITRGHLVRHLHTASEAFPMDWFLHFLGSSQKAGGLMSELYDEWGSTCHPYFSKFSDIAPEA
jgi:hypothetical protein